MRELKDKFGKRIFVTPNDPITLITRIEYCTDKVGIERIYLRCGKFHFPMFIEDVLPIAAALVKLIGEVLQIKKMQLE